MQIPADSQWTDGFVLVDTENLCFFSLAETNSKVLKALADDFDTPRAMGAVMNLVYQGNCQLQPVSTVSSCFAVQKKNYTKDTLIVTLTCHCVCVVSVTAQLAALQFSGPWSVT